MSAKGKAVGLSPGEPGAGSQGASLGEVTGHAAFPQHVCQHVLDVVRGARPRPSAQGFHCGTIMKAVSPSGVNQTSRLPEEEQGCHINPIAAQPQAR